MARSKKFRVVKYSAVFNSMFVEIGHVVEDQVIGAALLPDSEFALITDPNPWGFSGEGGLVAKDALEPVVEVEERVERERRNAVPPQPEG